MSDASGLQAVLAAEHAAIYGYGIAGAVLVRQQAASAVINTVRANFDAHRQSRDQLTAAIATLHAAPATAQAAYQLPFDVNDQVTAMRVLVLLEDRLSAVAATAVAVSGEASRRLCADVLGTSAVRGARLRLLGNAPTPSVAIPFPGLAR